MKKPKLIVIFVISLLCLGAFSALWRSGYATADLTPPTYSVPATPYSGTKNWTSSIVSALFDDDVNVSTVFVSQNSSGTWAKNITLIPTWINSTACWANYTILLPKTVNTIVGFNWTANDTSDNRVFTPTYTLTTTANIVNYTENAVWIQDAAWSGFPASKHFILTNNLTGLANDLGNNSIKYAFLFVGYWNATSNNINYQHNDAFYANVINRLHASGVKVIAWGEDGGGGTMDVTPANRQNIYNAIIACMYKGFDGYNDDIEAPVGTHQQVLDYLNNCTTVLHAMGKLMTADIAYDWQQNMNHYLYMDYIASMFYSSHSTFEDPQSYAYWQENFGIYGGDHGAATSPLILGIMNYYGNAYPLPWQLNQAAYCMSTYSNRSLVGFCLWLYEYVGTRADDWLQWNYWINRIGTAPVPLCNVTLSSSPVSRAGFGYLNTMLYTPSILFSFNISVSITAPLQFTAEAHHVLFGMTDHGGSWGFSSYTYTGGPYTLSTITPVTQVYFYAKVAGNVKIAIYNATTYVIPGWVGTNEHPFMNQTQSAATYCPANTWTLIAVPSVILQPGDYFFAAKGDTTAMLGEGANVSLPVSAYYGHGQFISQSYSTPFSQTFPSVSGAMGSGDLSIYIPTGAIGYTPFNFQKWQDNSTATTITMAKLDVITPITAFYSSSSPPPPPPPSTFILTILVLSNGQNITGATVLVANSSLMTINGIASFTLQTGNYVVSVTYLSLNSTTNVELNADEQITINLASPTPSLNTYWPIILLAILLILGLIFIVLKKRKK